ncbi:fucolectin-1-like [Hoplias malabaricus]|uniref:fucolectin-1-like n=1 Tax=Hoplias malabaricus TaxID=27720 RepID=UPI003461EA40
MGKLTTGAISPQTDVALGKIATQSSSSYPMFLAPFAIDGNRDSNVYAMSCSYTDYYFKPWWRVDLLIQYQISSVVITNRGDCCPTRIDGAEIRIGNSLENNGNNNPRCAVIPDIPAGSSSTFSCDMIGRYVNVVIPKNGAILTLCEVEIYGVPAVTKKINLRVKFHTSEDMIDSTTRHNVFQQFLSALTNEMVSALKLYWTQEPELEHENKGFSDPSPVHYIQR